MPSRGEIREDGMIFWRSRRGREQWLDHATFDQYRERQRKSDQRRYEQGERLERANATAADWRRRNRVQWNGYKQSRRAKSSAHKCRITKIELQVLQDEAGGRCFYCRVDGKLTVDHIIPLAKGGPHHICNLVMACNRCNSRKSDSHPEDFMLRVRG